jgi:hypothetical protein
MCASSECNEILIWALLQRIYDNIVMLYPTASVWFTGHSLGGAIAALTALSTGNPAVAFQAPGDRQYAKRLGLRIPDPETEFVPIYHFSNTGDPIFFGKCRGARSACYLAGYALETGCHLGNVCMYQAARSLDIRYHRIGYVIDKVIAVNDEVPECIPEDEHCTDCSDWNFIEWIQAGTRSQANKCQEKVMQSPTAISWILVYYIHDRVKPTGAASGIRVPLCKIFKESFVSGRSNVCIVIAQPRRIFTSSVGRSAGYGRWASGSPVRSGDIEGYRDRGWTQPTTTLAGIRNRRRWRRAARSRRAGDISSAAGALTFPWDSSVEWQPAKEAAPATMMRKVIEIYADSARKNNSSFRQGEGSAFVLLQLLW